MATDKTPSEDYLGFVEIFRGVRPDIETGSMFGMRCMKRGGKAFAGGFAGGLVVKLAPEALARAAALTHATEFDPSGGGRPMKAWIVLGSEHQDRWQEYAEAAYAAVEATGR